WFFQLQELVTSWTRDTGSGRKPIGVPHFHLLVLRLAWQHAIITLEQCHGAESPFPLPAEPAAILCCRLARFCYRSLGRYAWKARREVPPVSAPRGFPRGNDEPRRCSGPTALHR